MQSELSSRPLGDLVEPDTPITYGVVKPGPEDSEGVLFVRGGDIADGRILVSQLRTITKEVSAQYSRTLLRGHELVVSLVGNPGQVALVPASLRGANIARQVGLVRLAHGVDPRFVKYFLGSPAGQEALGAQSRGSVQQVINLRDLRTVRVPLPPYRTQQGIADVFSCIDDRIDLLRQTSATLESIAQALFKSWFIDFDPVRAKAEGREPEGMDAATAALFPAEFEASALGVIPKGWTVEPIGELIEALGGSTPDTKNGDFWEPAAHHWTSPKDLSGATAPVLLDTERKVSDAGLAKISSGLLPAGTLLMSSRAPIGYLSLTQIPVAINQGYIAMPPGGTLPPVYAYFWCQANMDAIKGRANGSTFMEISKKAFRPILALLPPKGLIASFVSTAALLFERITANEQQARALAETRDTLLPRLISGKLRLPEAQELAEAV